MPDIFGRGTGNDAWRHDSATTVPRGSFDAVEDDDGDEEMWDGPGDPPWQRNVPLGDDVHADRSDEGDDVLMDPLDVPVAPPPDAPRGGDAGNSDDEKKDDNEGEEAQWAAILRMWPNNRREALRKLRKHQLLMLQRRQNQSIGNASCSPSVPLVDDKWILSIRRRAANKSFTDADKRLLKGAIDTYFAFDGKPHVSYQWLEEICVAIGYDEGLARLQADRELPAQRRETRSTFGFEEEVPGVRGKVSRS